MAGLSLPSPSISGSLAIVLHGRTYLKPICVASATGTYHPPSYLISYNQLGSSTFHVKNDVVQLLTYSLQWDFTNREFSWDFNFFTAFELCAYSELNMMALSASAARLFPVLFSHVKIIYSL